MASPKGTPAINASHGALAPEPSKTPKLRRSQLHDAKKKPKNPPKIIVLDKKPKKTGGGILMPMRQNMRHKGGNAANLLTPAAAMCFL